MSHLEKWVIVDTIAHTYENGLNLEKMSHTSKSWSQLEERVSLEKVGHTWKCGSHVVKCVTI